MGGEEMVDLPGAGGWPRPKPGGLVVAYVWTGAWQSLEVRVVTL